ncbi:Hypothetical protein; putative exported protein [Herminiimonas arsenicoxydans]|uniref:Uncharacterized protein n=1 Tax=Herminiimonas arsenicoxydans TaxID=204773 RepID=A4G7I3_HERAR|nr:Hypothetical protein; putative exported protein [Herminiimonas arsenicoxydans]
MQLRKLSSSGTTAITSGWQMYFQGSGLASQIFFLIERLLIHVKLLALLAPRIISTEFFNAGGKHA